MEVHHHPDLHHKAKPWKEYLLEFLMIFLAVTMGFYAENIREHFSNNDKEHTYIRGFEKDLKADSVFIRGMAYFLQVQEKRLDTMMYLISSGKCKAQAATFYRLALESRSVYYFQYVNTTFEQLKSSGNFGLIRDTMLKNYLVQYDNGIHDVIFKQENRWLKANDNQTAYQWTVLDGTVYMPVDNTFMMSTGKVNAAGDFVKQPVITNADMPGLLKFYNLLYEKRLIFPGYLQMMAGLKAGNKVILERIRTKYDLR